MLTVIITLMILVFRTGEIIISEVDKSLEEKESNSVTWCHDKDNLDNSLSIMCINNVRYFHLLNEVSPLYNEDGSLMKCKCES